MITKFTIICLCVASSAMFGLARLKSKKRRLDCISSYVNLCNMLISDISFRKDNLLKLLESFAETDNSELKEHITKFCAAPYQSFEIKSKLLKPNEKRIFEEFFMSLGSTDSETQLTELLNYKDKFEALYDAENEKYKKTANMEMKLFILAGIAIGILLL